MLPHDLHPFDSDSGTVLVVDDENGVRELMSRWLQAGGYSVSSASGADEALGLMQTVSPAVALCDIRMPGRDGLWLVDRIVHQYPETAVIMATAVPDAGPTIAGLGDGVVGYLTKPFGCDRLRDAVMLGIEWHRTARACRRWRERLELELHARRTRLATAIGALQLESERMLDAMMANLTDRDKEAYRHARDVATLAAAVAERLALPPDEVALIRRAALLHDLGKLAIPEPILRKPAPLSDDEREIVRQYPQLGADLLADVPCLVEVAAIVRSSQERWDGHGYPNGQPGESLPIGARIIAAADAYVTMIGRRVFRDALSPGDAILELERCSGTQFDPKVVAVLRQVTSAVH
jgi:putative nucleotidyltransferase with HDIG domain